MATTFVSSGLGLGSNFGGSNFNTTPAGYFTINSGGGNTGQTLAQQQALTAQTLLANSNKSVTGGGSITSSNRQVNVPQVTARNIPSFIPVNPEPLLKELRATLGSIPNIINVKGITDAYRNRIAMDESLGRQTADNAAREFGARSAQEGGDPSIAGVVRAQALLPVLQQSKALEGELQDKRLQANTAIGQLSAGIAEAISSLRTNYLGTLANYTANLQNLSEDSRLRESTLAEQSRQFNLSHGLDMLKTQAQLDAARNANSNNVNKSSNNPQYQGPINYVPNAGPLTIHPSFAGFLANNPNAPRYGY